MALVADIPDEDNNVGDGFFWNSKAFRNMLRNYNSYNYIITLGVLSRSSYNVPNTYRTKGFDKILLRSAGGGLEKRVRTFAEGELHAEYFIEDLEIDSVVAPNQNTGPTMATNISFKVIEPYSMGKFLEAMMIAANELGYDNHHQIPLALQIEFAGWNTPGQSGLTGNESPTYITNPIFIPIMISKMEFDVTEKGSTYNIAAIGYTDALMSNNRDSLKTDVGVSGVTVADVLQNTYYSLAPTINKRYEKLEEDKIILGYDRYLILFPDKLSDILEIVQGGPVSPATLSGDIRGQGGQLAAERGVEGSSPLDIYDKLKNWSIANINDIGKSVITESLRDGGSRRTPDAGDTMNPEGISNPESNPNERIYQFQRNESISAIIQEVVLASRYATDNAINPSDTNGFKKWFRIKPMVFIEKRDVLIERQLGRPRLTYVYAVYKVDTHEARHLPASQTPKGIDYLRNNVKKIYNYIYTGRNEDVLNFEIKFNHAFFLPAILDISNADGSRSTDLGDAGKVSGLKLADVKSTTPPEDSKNSPPPTGESTIESIANGGTLPITANSAKHKIAQLFHHRLINSPVDMITAEIDIWGDPYFLPSDIGNYSVEETDTLITTDDTLPHASKDVHIIVNFKTPIDYNDGLDGLMSFPDDDIQTFSGLYQVWALTNTFSEGLFKQHLKLLRVSNQSVNDPTENTAYVEPYTGPR